MRNSWWIPLLYLTLTTAVFWPSLHGEFIMDDWGYITTNAQITQTASPLHFWTSLSAVPDYWPVSYTFYWIFYRLFGEVPTGYHVINFLLHALNGTLVYLMARSVAPRMALWAGLIFLVHPLHVQAVSWIIQFKTLLATALALGSWLALRSQKRLLSIGLFSLSMLAKSSGVLFPVALLVLDWRPRTWLKNYWPYFLVSLVGGILTVWANHLNFKDLQAPVFHTTWYQRLPLALQNLSFYLEKFFWPTDLSYMYPHPVSDWTWTMAVPLLAGALAWWRWRSAWLYVYLLWLLPALGLVLIPNMKLSLIADHWSYLPNVALIVFLAQGLERMPWRSGTLALTTTAAIILGVAAFKHAETFATEEQFWRRAKELNPQSAAAAYNLGTALDKKSRTAEALAQYQAAVELDGGHARAWYNLARDQFLLGNLGAARDGFMKAIELDPSIVASFVSLAKVNLVLQLRENALEVIQQGLVLHPDSSELMELKFSLQK